MSVSAIKSRVVLIDNYDSFTWNLYQYLCLEGAEVFVHRNDQITIAGIEALSPDVIFISPGPGHPTTDAGISLEAIRYFAGKVPVVGVCMGLQCMFTVFGGVVDYAGEIVHGKTSPITHDGKGMFEGVSDNIAITRYHSLAGMADTLPECLEVTARTDNGIIMGVRHKEFTVEGVQFHPESILTEEGHTMVRNVLKIRGGTWAENDKIKSLTASRNTKQKSILDKVYEQRKIDVEQQKKIPGQSFAHLEKSLPYAPKLIDVVARLKETVPALMAEVKRASPSKGDIDITAHAPTQALIYANAGASAISVLTEPHYFKGSIEDLRLVRLALDGLPNRPAVLRKEFIFDEYQILEARLNGADTVLLIVKMIVSDEVLSRLYNYSVSLGMEPLVEVSNGPEMERALKLGSKLIGVNNRDLHSFNVDMSTTSTLVKAVPEGTVLAALSGILKREDVEKYEQEGVGAVLIGEALMRADDTTAFVKELLGR